MMKGVCAACGMLRWIRGRGGCCKPCGYPIGPCAQCGGERKLFVDSLCYLCYQDRQVRSHLLTGEADWTPQQTYSRYLFHLYLLYIRRYLLKYSHLSQTKRLSEILTQNPPEPILSWMRIYELSERDREKFSRTAQKGCAWMKIGFMLQELGVIPLSEDDKGREFRAILQTFSVTERSWIDPLIEDLTRTGRAQGTILNQLQSIRYLMDWISSQALPATLLQVNHLQIQNFVAHLQRKSVNLIFVRKHMNSLHRFYRGCLRRKLVLVNPCDNLLLSREAPRLPICSPEQTEKLFAFVKNPNSSAEEALMIALVLYWGFTCKDLACAQLTSVHQLPLQITLRRTPRTKGRRYYNRSQVLTLANQPTWFLNLQKQFLSEWSNQYEQVKKTYPFQYLFLPKNGLSNRPLSTEIIRDRFNLATQKATGVQITVRVVRQTCGHIHSQKSDVSVLTRLGWSPQFAFHYTWLPRIYISIKNHSANSSPS